MLRKYVNSLNQRGIPIISRLRDVTNDAMRPKLRL